MTDLSSGEENSNGVVEQRTSLKWKISRSIDKVQELENSKVVDKQNVASLNTTLEEKNFTIQNQQD